MLLNLFPELLASLLNWTVAHSLCISSSLSKHKPQESNVNHITLIFSMWNSSLASFWGCGRGVKPFYWGPSAVGRRAGRTMRWDLFAGPDSAASQPPKRITDFWSLRIKSKLFMFSQVLFDLLPILCKLYFYLVSLIFCATTLLKISFFGSSVAVYYFLPTWLLYVGLSLPKTSFLSFCLDHPIALVSVEMLLPLKSLSWLPHPRLDGAP